MSRRRLSLRALSAACLVSLVLSPRPNANPTLADGPPWFGRWHVDIPAPLSDVPVEGVLVLSASWEEGAGFDDEAHPFAVIVVDGDGVPVPGTAQERADIGRLVWRSLTPLEAGTAYSATVHLDAPAANVHLTYAREFTTAAGPADPVAAPEAVEVVVDLADSSLYLCQRRHASFSVVPAGGESPDHVYYQLQPTVNGVFWGLLTYAPNEITPWDWTFAPGSGPWCATATAVSLIDHSGASTEEVCVTEEDYESLLGDEENLCTGDEVAVPDSPPGETTDDIPYIAMPDTGCGGASDSGVPPAPWLLMLIALLVVRRPTASKEWRLPGSRQRRSSPSAA